MTTASQKLDRLLTAIMRDRFLVLLAALVLLFLISPVVEVLQLGPFFARLLLTIVFVILLIATFFAVRATKSSRLIAWCLLIPALVFETTTIWITDDRLILTEYLFSGLFLAYMIYVILRAIFEARRVTANVIYAALCAYFLLAIFWSVIYSTVYVVDNSAFNYPLLTNKEVAAEFRPGTATSSSSIYFSFVTITTLGYGDVIPVSTAARSLASLQAMIGQLYLAVLVARLVGLHIVHAKSNPP